MEAVLQLQRTDATVFFWGHHSDFIFNEIIMHPTKSLLLSGTLYYSGFGNEPEHAQHG